MGFWYSVFLFAFSTILNELFRPKPKREQLKPAGVGDFSFPTATEDRVVPWLFGTVEIKGPNFAWWGDLRANPIVDSVQVSLLSDEDIIRGYRYAMGFQLLLCGGGEYPVDELTRVRIGEKEAFSGSVAAGGTFTIDKPQLFGDPDEGGTGGVQGTFQFFAGSNTQSPSSYLGSAIVTGATIAAAGTGYTVGDTLFCVGGTFGFAARFRVDTVGVSDAVATVSLLSGGIYSTKPSNPVSTTVATLDLSPGSGCTLNLTFGAGFQSQDGVTPAYRGFCYVTNYENRAYVGNTTTPEPWAITLRRTPNPVGLTSGNEIVNSKDANPVNVLYIALTAKDGFRFDPSTIDLTSFGTAGDTLAVEGNGFSMLIDNPEAIEALVQRVEQQIDGVLIRDESDKKWKIALARDDYTPGAQPELTVDNVLEVKSWTRGSWEATANQVRVSYNDAGDDYKRTSALAQDMANVQIQDGAISNAEEAHPGVKDGDLASAIAWRSLRTLAYPLAKGTFVVDRTLWDVQINDVVELTYARLNVTRLPMRVNRVDRSDFASGRITIDMIQDVFYSAAGSFAATPSSGWTAPGEDLAPFPAGEQLVLEAPRAIVARDPNSASPDLDKLLVAARLQSVESSYDIRERNAVGSPSGDYSSAGNVPAFALIGELNAALSGGTAVPTSAIVVTPTPDSQEDIEAAFADLSDPVEIGTELRNLIYVGSVSGGGEFMLVSSASDNASNVQLNDVYRGVLDSVTQDHASGTSVFLLFGRAGISTAIPAGNNVDAKLIPKSVLGEVDEANATTVSLTLANRVRRPYPPAEMSLNSSRFASTTSLEGSGSGEDVGIALAFIRRDFRTTDEVASLQTDAATIDSTYPSANSTTHAADVRDDPDGSNTLLYEEDLASASSGTLRRLDILQNNAGVLPTRLRVSLGSEHTYSGTSYESTVDLVHDFDVTSALTGAFAFGALDTDDVSNSFTVADDSTDHDFDISSSFTAGDVQYRINAGSWTTLISAGGTSGTIGSGLITNGDTIDVRHRSSDSGAQKLLEMDLSATLTAFAVLHV